LGFVVCCLLFVVCCLVFGAFCLTCYRCSETGLLIRPAVVDALKIMGFLFFFLDEKEPKNQENFKLSRTPAALPAKFSGQRTIFPKEIFMGAGIFVFCLLFVVFCPESRSLSRLFGALGINSTIVFQFVALLKIGSH
jgi:hypothetical protein